MRNRIVEVNMGDLDVQERKPRSTCACWAGAA